MWLQKRFKCDSEESLPTELQKKVARMARNVAGINEDLENQIRDLLVKPEKNVVIMLEQAKFMEFELSFLGETGGLFANGEFKAKIYFEQAYPRTAPAVQFSTEISHPNVDPKSQWIRAEFLSNWLGKMTDRRMKDPAEGYAADQSSGSESPDEEEQSPLEIEAETVAARKAEGMGLRNILKVIGELLEYPDEKFIANSVAYQQYNTWMTAKSSAAWGDPEFRLASTSQCIYVQQALYCAIQSTRSPTHNREKERQERAEQQSSSDSSLD